MANCSICFNCFEDNDEFCPRMIPCGHTYCSSCLVQMISQMRKIHHNQFVCPTCRSSHPLPALSETTSPTSPCAVFPGSSATPSPGTSAVVPPTTTQSSGVNKKRLRESCELNIDIYPKNYLVLQELLSYSSSSMIKSVCRDHSDRTVEIYDVECEKGICLHCLLVGNHIGRSLSFFSHCLILSCFIRS